MNISIHMADGAKSSVSINIDMPFVQHEGDDWQTIHTQRFKDDAKDIADAFERTLPGGTFAQLLVEMLSRRASHFVVPFFSQDKDV